jgi:hypothetical protein
MNNKLIKLLEEFDKKRTNFLKKEGVWNENSVAKCFHPCAEKLLLKGYFLVNDEYIIDLGAIELYYHEEEGKIKDSIMYHTNEHPSKSKVFELNGGYPYFKIGSFNMHQSGVDVTFENGEDGKKYRASFLIRSYRVFRKGDEHKLNDLTIPFDNCSTHIFDDMFYNGVLSSDNASQIKWKTKRKDGSIKQDWRRNVAMYLNSKKVSKEDFEANIGNLKETISSPQFFKYNGEYYLKEERMWQYKRAGIIEI